MITTPICLDGWDVGMLKTPICTNLFLFFFTQAVEAD